MKAQVHHSHHAKAGFFLTTLAAVSFLALLWVVFTNPIHVRHNGPSFQTHFTTNYSTAIKPVSNQPVSNFALISTMPENNVKVETWMFTPETWAENQIIEELNVESWMYNTESWATTEIAEPALEIENWMSNPETWLTTSNTSEPDLAVEPWMSDIEGWAHQSTHSLNDTSMVL